MRAITLLLLFAALSLLAVKAVLFRRSERAKGNTYIEITLKISFSQSLFT